MKKRFIVLPIFFLLSSCASPTPAPSVDDTPFDIPTIMYSTPEVYVYPTVADTILPTSLDDVKFLTEFSDKKADWQILPGTVTAAQINAEVAQQEGDQIQRAEQKVINGFLRVTVTQVGGQVFEVLSPAEVVDGKLKVMKVNNVKQVPVLSIHAVLLADYFETNFPDVVMRWELQGAQYEDFKYAAIVTVTWATKYGPLRVSYKTSGKYISEEGKYPGRIDFLKMCMYEQTKEHFLPNNRQGPNWYPVPIVGLSGITKNIAGEMKSDTFGWTPMVDFAKDESETLDEIGNTVSGVAIESKETLEELQAAFDRAFMPVHCAETLFEYKK